MAILNFLGNPNTLKERIAAMDDEKFMLFFKKKEEQWYLLNNTKGAYSVFHQDADAAYERDRLCMVCLWDEKDKRGL